MRDSATASSPLSLIGAARSEQATTILALDAPGAALRVLVSAQAALVLSPADGRPLTDKTALAERHDLVCAVSDLGAFLPARLGVEFDHPDTAQAWLDAHDAALTKRLAVVDGCVEYGVRVTASLTASDPAPGVSTTAQTGAGYLREQRQRAHDRTRLETMLNACADRLRDGLSGLVKDIRHGITTVSNQAVLRADILTPAPTSDQVARALEDPHRLIDPPAGADIRTSGPWPTYTFGGLSRPSDRRKEVA